MTSVLVSGEFVEALMSYSDADNTKVYVGGEAIEVLMPVPTRSPTTITGAGVSHEVIEVLMDMNSISYNVSVSQDAIEVLMLGESSPSISAATIGWVSL